MLPTVALLLMTAVWGVTFVQVKDAVELYPIFLFLGLRFAVASAALGVPFGRRLRLLDRRGLASGVLLGTFLATGYALQTVGLSKTSVTSTGFITGLFVPLTPVFAALIFRDRIGASGWVGTGLATAGLALLSGVEVGSAVASLLLFGGACSFALHIVFTSRFAPRYDIAALTLLQMLVAFAACGLIGLAAEPLETPRGWTVWGAVLVTGLFASALGFVVQTWAQSKTTATKAALVIRWSRSSPASSATCSQTTVSARRAGSAPQSSSRGCSWRNPRSWIGSESGAEGLSRICYKQT